MSSEHKRRPALRWAAFFVMVGAIMVGAYQALFHPNTPISTAWNPMAALVVSDPVTPVTAWKLRRDSMDETACLSALSQAAMVEITPHIEARTECGIDTPVRMSHVGHSRIEPIMTSCAIALRMAMWEQHGLQPAAEEILGTQLSEIRQIGSYNCRRIRTTSGNNDSWSTHATAEAIDITGFRFVDGRQVSLLQGWAAGDPEAQFLQAARDSACIWFATTLGPEFNSLHADHFHLQSRGWGTCR